MISVGMRPGLLGQAAAAAYLHAWNGATPAGVEDPTGYTLGVRFSLFANVTMYGFRVYSPGNDTSTPRYLYLWSGPPAGPWTLEGTVTAPDKLPAGWSEYLWPTPKALVTGTQYMMAMDVGAGTGNDYAAVANGVASNVDNAQIRLDAGGGRYGPVGGPPTNGSNAYYSVDLLYL